MNIGIITWFSGGNYGTNLQAIALQYYLRAQGHEVKLLNFEVSVLSNNNRRDFLTRLSYQPEKYITKYFDRKYKEAIAYRKFRIKETVQKYCIFTKKIESKEDYIRECNSFDLIICGSDQIWNPNWYHRYYYADYPEIKARKISYAPSLGINSIPEEKAKEIKMSLKGFDAISVRESIGARILSNLSPVEPQVVVDPTLLLGAREWSKIASNKVVSDQYVLSMFLTDNLRHWHAAKIFSKKKKMKHIVIPYCGISYTESDQLYVDAGIEDFLALIRDADYVLTDSFHVIVFCLIFNRQFVAFQRFKEDQFTSQNSRIDNLLGIATVKDRLLRYRTSKIPPMEDIDYQLVNKTLQIEIEKSKDYLLKAIGGKKIAM